MSCKKDLLETPTFQNNKVAGFKKWYDSDQSNISAVIKSSNGETTKLIFNPLWEKASVETVNGYTVLTAAVNTPLRNFDQGATKFNLVIRSIGDQYEGKIVTIKNTAENTTFTLTPKELNEIAFQDNALLKKDFNAQVKVLSTNFSEDKEEIYKNSTRYRLTKDPNESPKASSAPGYLVCYDYWLVVDYYDVYNALIGHTETYLGQYCEATDVLAIWWIDNGDGTYGGGSSYEYEEERPEFTNEVNDPCLKDLVDLVLQNDVAGLMSDIINRLDTNRHVKIRFKEALNTPNNSIEELYLPTFNPNTNVFSAEIILSQSMLLNTSKENVIGVIIHEVLHGYFRHSVMALNKFNLIDHDEMSQNYIEPMVEFLV